MTKKTIDVLLVNPPSPDKSIIIRDLNRSGRTSREQIIWPQTNLAYLAAMIPSNLKVEILDCIAEKIGWEEFKKILQEKKPKYVAGHVITSTVNNDLKTFKEAKKIGAKTITMGPHVTELTKLTLEQNPDLDFIILKECELTFEELIHSLEKNEKDFSQIKGLAWRNERKGIIINEPRPFIEDLDTLPLPRHDLLPIKKYIFPFMASEFTFVVSSRGCPFPCTFCRQPIMWSGKVRSRSAESLIKEMKLLKKLGIKNFLFHSDTFTIDKTLVQEFCKMMIDQNLNLKWACNSRVDTLDEETLKLMKKAGCWMIAFGFESGSQEILDLCKKRATVKQGIELAKLTDKVGIKVYGYFVMGLVGETRESMQKTVDFAKNLPITFAIFHVASPYPGTEFYQQVKDNQWLINEKWESTNQGGTSPVNYPQLSGEEITTGIKKAYRSFYLRPVTIWRILKSVRNFSDLKHLISSGINQIF